MKRPNFFCDIDSLNCLLGMEFEGDYKDIDLTMDLIELPYMFIFTSDDENWTVRAMQRGEIYSHDDSGIESGSVVVNKVSGEGQVKATRELGENMGAFFQACRNISSFIQEKGLEPLYAELDPEEAGIMLSMNGDELTYKVVSGKDRPDMMCTTLFGAPTMCRPYMDDFMANSEMEMMSFEERLEAAEEGNENAMEAVAMAYLNGSEEDDIDEDPEQAVYWFTKLAELDNPSAQFNLGLHCAKGHGIKRDFEKAAYWMQRAADNGDDDAPALVEKYTKAAEAIKKIADNDAQAQADLAGVLMALAGSLEQAGVGDDYDMAFELAKKSADQNNGDGIWALALCYEHGRGVGKNQSIALECYERGAELGHASSMHSLACYYLRGDIVEQNLKMGFELIIRAALLGNGLAMRDAGRCYQFGNGCMGNMKKAVAWYKKALEVIDDDELAQKTATFEMMLGMDTGMDEDYPGEDTDRELTAEEKAFIDKIDSTLSDEVKELILNPDVVIESYIEAFGNGIEFDDDDDAESDEDDGWAPPAGYMEAMEAFEEAEEYETELAKQGVLPDAPKPGNGVMSLSADGFPRVALKAEEGDERALAIIAKMNAANGM